MMPGVRDPQPPPTSSIGLPASATVNRRRRHSLPALSSDELNSLSANASKSRTGRTAKNTGRSQPEDPVKKSPRATAEKNGKSGAKSSVKILKPAAKSLGSSRESEDEAFEDVSETFSKDDGTAEGDGSDSPVSSNSGSSTLQSKVQSSKSNAVFIFRFDDDDNKSKEETSQSPATPGDPSPPAKQENQSNSSQIQLSQTWPFDSIEERNAFNLLKNSVRFNTLGFCGVKHKQFRESGKLHKLMTPVMELKTPMDETDYESEDEWSVDSSSDYWTDTRSSNDTNSPRASRSRDNVHRRQSGPVKLNANCNVRLTSDNDSRYLSANLRSALALSPRRTSSDRPSLSSLREFSQRTRDKQSGNPSPQRRTVRRGSLDSTVGQIFNNLKAVPPSTATPPVSTATKSVPSSSSSVQSPTSSSSSNKLSVRDDNTFKFKPTSPLPPRLLDRRRSLGALPDVASFNDSDDTKSKRRNSLLSSRSDPTLSKNSTTKRFGTSRRL